MNAPVQPVPDTVVLAAVADLLRAEHKLHAVWCESCGRRHIRGEMPGPYVDVAPTSIPADDHHAHNRVADLIGQLPAHRLGDGRVRIPLPSAGHAITTAALLLFLGAPKHAVHIGGTS